MDKNSIAWVLWQWVEPMREYLPGQCSRAVRASRRVDGTEPRCWGPQERVDLPRANRSPRPSARRRASPESGAKRRRAKSQTPV